MWPQMLTVEWGPDHLYAFTQGAEDWYASDLAMTAEYYRSVSAVRFIAQLNRGAFVITVMGEPGVHVTVTSGEHPVVLRLEHPTSGCWAVFRGTIAYDLQRDMHNLTLHELLSASPTTTTTKD